MTIMIAGRFWDSEEDFRLAQMTEEQRKIYDLEEKLDQAMQDIEYLTYNFILLKWQIEDKKQQ